METDGKSQTSVTPSSVLPGLQDAWALGLMSGPRGVCWTWYLDPKYNYEGRATRAGIQLVEILYLSLGLGSCVSKALAGGVTLLSSGPLGHAPRLGAEDTQLLIRNLWHCRRTQEDRILLQGA